MDIREHDKHYNKWEGHSMSQNVTGVLDRNAPDVVVEVHAVSFQTPHDTINKQTTTDGYETTTTSSREKKT